MVSVDAPCHGQRRVSAECRGCHTARAPARKFGSPCRMHCSPLWERRLPTTHHGGQDSGPGTCGTIARIERPGYIHHSTPRRPPFDGSVVRKPSHIHLNRRRPAHHEPVGRQARTQCRPTGQKAQGDSESQERNYLARAGTQEATGTQTGTMGFQASRYPTYNVGA